MAAALPFIVATVGGALINNLTSKQAKSKPVIDNAAITPEQRQQLFQSVGNLAGFNFSPKGGFTPQNVTQQFPQIPTTGNNIYQQMFSSALSNPYIPTSAENQLLSNVMDQTSAQFANRGLGASPIAASSVAASIAPSLIAMRQQQLSNLLSGFQTQDQANQNVMSNLLTQRGQDINSLLTQHQQQLSGLLQFLEQMGFRRNVGTVATGGTGGALAGLPIQANWNMTPGSTGGVTT